VQINIKREWNPSDSSDNGDEMAVMIGLSVHVHVCVCMFTDKTTRLRCYLKK